MVRLRHVSIEAMRKQLLVLSFFIVVLIVPLVTPLMADAARSNGLISRHQKISDTEGDFDEVLDNGDGFGICTDTIGDLNDDGVEDFVVGAWKDDDGGTNFGASYILFMNRLGTVESSQKISMTTGGFTGGIDSADDFGEAVTGIGDLDLDGIEDIVISERASDDGGTDRGALYVLFMNANGTVKAQQEISDLVGGFTGVLDNFDVFGGCVESIEDQNSDGIPDLAVCAASDDDGGTDRGAVWILHMNRDGTVASHTKISDTEGGFTTTLDNSDKFGTSVAVIPDLNGDGVDEWAVGAVLDDDGGASQSAERGAVYILFRNADGSIASEVKISDLTTNFAGQLSDGDRFGASIASLGDLDGDGLSEIVVGAWNDDDGGTDRGAFYIIFLDSTGGVKRFQKVSSTEGNFTGTLDNSDNLGFQITAADLNDDGLTEIATGAYLDDDGGDGRGALWIFYLQNIATGGTTPLVAPRNIAFSLNDGAACTANRDVTLSLSARSATEVLVSNEPFYLSSTWESFVGPGPTSKAWTLPDGDSQHTVYVRFRSSTGVLSGEYTQTIDLDVADACGVGEDTNEPSVPDEEPGTDESVYALSPITGEMELVESVGAGEYIRGFTNNTVYYISEDLKRRPFYGPRSFFTWQDSFDNVRLVTDATLPQFPMGALMLPKAGVVLVKMEIDPAVYVITEGETVRAIANESVAQAMFGTSWSDYVIDVPVYAFSHFSVDNQINDASEVTVDLGIMKRRTELTGEGEALSQLTVMFQSLWQKIITVF